MGARGDPLQPPRADRFLDTGAVTALDRWTRGDFTAEGVTHPTYRRGDGPGVIIVHEMPGMTPEVIAFADEVVDAGFAVVLPNLFGTAGAPMSLRAFATTVPRVCVNREFNKLAVGRTSPVATWLRALARDLHAQLGGVGVGALGMCFTGGFALAMMVDTAVAAPVVAQPSLPFPLGTARADDLNLSPDDLAAVKARAAAGCSVLGVKYAADPVPGTRFDRLDRELGSAFRRIELDGKGHSTLTAHRQQRAVDEVLAFFRDRLQPTAP
jgi:dienelactone hydrolase